MKYHQTAGCPDAAMARGMKRIEKERMRTESSLCSIAQI
jgi:hypothetical protein